MTPSAKKVRCARKGCGHVRKNHLEGGRSGFGYDHCESCHRREPLSSKTEFACAHSFLLPPEVHP